MFKKLQAKLRNKKGFTLVELLIVIAVLGIIAAIAVPRFTGVLGGIKSKAEVRTAELAAKEVEAEFMLEKWFIVSPATSIADGTHTVANTGTSDVCFNGEWPKDENGANMIITITKAGNDYTLTITDGDSTPNVLINAKKISGPVN